MNPDLPVRTDSYAGPLTPPVYAPEPRAPSSSSAGAGLLAGGGCAALAFLALAAAGLIGFSGVFDAEPAASTARRPAVATSPANQTAPLTAVEPVNQRHNSCPTDSDICSCCSSGHDCLGRCSDYLLPSETFRLRYAGGGRLGLSLEKGGLEALLQRALRCWKVEGQWLKAADAHSYVDESCGRARGALVATRHRTRAVASGAHSQLAR